MKKSTIISFLLLFSVSCLAQNDSVLITAEIMPMFPGCEEILDLKERQDCANMKMLMFIYNNVKYPSMARENGIEGTVITQFIIEKDGKISEISIIRDPGGNLGTAVVDVMNLMQEQSTWSPGIQEGIPVRVKFTLPVKFKIDRKSKRKKKKKN